MKVLDFFNPYADLAEPIGGAKPAPVRLRVASGIAFDPASGHLLVVDPDPNTRLDQGIYELTTGGAPVRSVHLPATGALHPFGIAVEHETSALWLSDWLSNRLLRVERDGRQTASWSGAAIGTPEPGALTFRDAEDRSIFVTDRSRNVVTRVRLNQRASTTFELTPFDGAQLRGITCVPDSGNLLLSYAPRVAEREGHVGKSVILETTVDGKVLNDLDTASLGFCALDVAMHADAAQLFAVSRQFVLANTPGDHAHVFVVDLDDAPVDNRVCNTAILWRFLKSNNLEAGAPAGHGRTKRWPDGPIPVALDGLIDLSARELTAVLDAWVECSSGAVAFELCQVRPPYGIVIIQGEVSFCEGRPGPDNLVTVCVGDRRHPASHPHWMDARSAQHNVARHELGHALGFLGHSPRFRIDTMNSISGFSEGISAEEAEFMRLLYGFPAGTAAPAIEAACRRERLLIAPP